MNRAWREDLGTTQEWAALDMVRIDTPSLIRYLVEHCECCPLLRDRVKCELESINFLLA